MLVPSLLTPFTTSASPPQRDGCPKIVNLGSSKTDLFYERKKCAKPPARSHNAANARAKAADSDARARIRVRMRARKYGERGSCAGSCEGAHGACAEARAGRLFELGRRIEERRVATGSEFAQTQRRRARRNPALGDENLSPS
eukprot:6204289-Pleurochrysis_carterae.AAC.2